MMNISIQPRLREQVLTYVFKSIYSTIPLFTNKLGESLWLNQPFSNLEIISLLYPYSKLEQLEGDGLRFEIKKALLEKSL